MENNKESLEVSVEYNLAEYKAFIRDFTPAYLEEKHPNRNPYYPWNWPVTEKLLMAVLVPLIFKWKVSKVGTCEFIFREDGFSRASKRGQSFCSWSDVSQIRQLSSAYLIQLSSGGAMPIPFRVFSEEERTQFESFASAAPNKGFNRTPESSGPAKPGEFGGGAG